MTIRKTKMEILKLLGVPENEIERGVDLCFCLPAGSCGEGSMAQYIHIGSHGYFEVKWGSDNDNKVA